MKKLFYVLALVFLMSCILISCANKDDAPEQKEDKTPECKHENCEIVLGKEATCTDAGLTEGSKCTDCGTICVEQTIISALGHSDGDWIVETEPTETTEGYKYKECTRCGEKIDEKFIPQIQDIGLAYEVNDDGVSCTITGIGSYTGAELKIPEYIMTYKVTAIGEEAFIECTSITSVTIPDGMTNIGDCAFYDCTNLTSVTIPNSVTNIGIAAFFDCAITSINIPNSVTIIGDAAFSYCTSLINITVDKNNTAYKSVDGNLYSKDGKTLVQYAIGKLDTNFVIPDGVTIISFDAFSWCTSLKSITIPDSVTTIGTGGFSDCKNLTSIIIPGSVTTIGEEAFSRCESLKSITIPDSVTTIGSWAFSSCESLTSVTIGNGVTSISSSMFSNCTSLTNVTIPDSVTSIGVHAFRLCISLTNITIPNNVTSIGAAFYDCTGLKSITIPNSVKSIGNDAFRGCTSLENVYYTGSEEDWANITIGSLNDKLIGATITYNYVP